MQHHFLNLVDQCLLSYLECQSPLLMEILRYSLGGKKIRSKLIYASAKTFGVSLNTVVHVTAAVECIHTYSLVHDDLPCMDNDCMRRGKPSVWHQFKENNAVLTGDYLQTLAFQILSDAKLSSPLIVLLAKELSTASMSMVVGQFFDVNKTTEHSWKDIAVLKTGSLFQFCVKVGPIISGAFLEDVKKVEQFGTQLGLLFQAKDDLKDEGWNHHAINPPVDCLGSKYFKDFVEEVFCTQQS